MEIDNSQRRNYSNTQMFNELAQVARYEEDLSMLRETADMREAFKLTDEDNLTYGELFEALEVKVGEDEIDPQVLIDACWNVHSNPKVMKLPDRDRWRVIRTANIALTNRFR